MNIELHYNFIGMSDHYIYNNVAVDYPFDIEKRFFNEKDLQRNNITTLHLFQI